MDKNVSQKTVFEGESFINWKGNKNEDCAIL